MLPGSVEVSQGTLNPLTEVRFLAGQPIFLIRHRKKRWSGRRDSNPRPSPWQGDALPTEPLPQKFMCAEGQNRTVDTSIFSAVLYRLSYLGVDNMLEPLYYSVKQLKYLSNYNSGRALLLCETARNVVKC